MRLYSHRMIGQFLARKYMAQTPDICVRAFLFGCTEPDRNPATYLKGSLRCQWLRGHHYPNARRYMTRLSRKLEQKESLTLPDYYRLGKLIHYTADAFTYPHNSFFPDGLPAHRSYEVRLQEFFRSFLADEPTVGPLPDGSVMDAIRFLHRSYHLEAGDPSVDSRYTLTACCSVVSKIKIP